MEQFEERKELKTQIEKNTIMESYQLLHFYLNEENKLQYFGYTSLSDSKTFQYYKNEIENGRSLTIRFIPIPNADGFVSGHYVYNNKMKFFYNENTLYINVQDNSELSMETIEELTDITKNQEVISGLDTVTIKKLMGN